MVRATFDQYDAVNTAMEENVQKRVAKRIPIISYLPTIQQIDHLKELKVPYYEEFLMWFLLALDTMEEETIEVKRMKSFLNMELCDCLMLVGEEST